VKAKGDSFFAEILCRSTFSYYFCRHKTNDLIMEQAKVIESIKQVARNVLPKGSSVYLYGSRARGDYHEGSDWDLLILLDKPKRDIRDWDNYAFPFVEKGWDIEEDISARTFTKELWYNGPHTLFYFNVEEDKKLLYES
jgi:predicted nucleotidyltransferase